MFVIQYLNADTVYDEGYLEISSVRRDRSLSLRSGGLDRGRRVSGGEGLWRDERHQLGLEPRPASHRRLRRDRHLRELDLAPAPERRAPPRGTAPPRCRRRLQAGWRRLRQQSRRLGYPPEWWLPKELTGYHWLPVWCSYENYLLTMLISPTIFIYLLIPWHSYIPLVLVLLARHALLRSLPRAPSCTASTLAERVRCDGWPSWSATPAPRPSLTEYSLCVMSLPGIIMDIILPLMSIVMMVEL